MTWFASVSMAQNTNCNTTAGFGLEVPKLADDSMSIFIERSTRAYGPTYSLEWDCSRLANRWTCYVLNDSNSLNNVSRDNSAFCEDTSIPKAYRTTNSMYTKCGYDRGHLCPSADRRCSLSQNAQTFLLSNIHPQFKKHNTSIWKALENMVRLKWNVPAFRDTLYVVKAATITDSLIYEKKTWSNLIVPKYFYCALLCLKDGAYKAMGIITPHKDVRTWKKYWWNYCVSVDSLEKFTGIDFFCNLPDSIEDEVEDDTLFTKWGIERPEN